MARGNANGTYVALLRGINVGGKNKLPMRELALIFVEAGCSDVATYIQSGNVVFKTAARTYEKLAATVEKQIAERHDLHVPVVLRSAAELGAVARKNPFIARGVDEKALHVMFLADAPSAQQIAALDPRRSPPDEFEVRGRDIYVSCPNGVGRSKLTNAWFDSKLDTTSTGRNWRTVLTLVEMSGG
jgi:uncharacterized protein (DUF1697 family)